MGLLDWLNRKTGIRPLLRLHIFMKYSIRLGSGAAAVRWRLLDPPLADGQTPILRCILVTVLYARILWIHRETRADLFSRVDKAVHDAGNAAGESEKMPPLDFDEWTLHVGLGGGDHRLWPWDLLPNNEMTADHAYVATLEGGRPTSNAPSGFSLNLQMTGGMERIKAPATALIAIHSLSRELVAFPSGPGSLAMLLWHINRYYGSPDGISALSDARALHAAMQSVQQAAGRAPGIGSA